MIHKTDLIYSMRGRIAVVTAHSSAVEFPSGLLSAVRHRPTPDAGALARYASDRLDEPRLLEPLARQFLEVLEGTPASTYCSVATYSRTFASYGPYTARHWRAVAQLVSEVGAARAGVSNDTIPTPHKVKLRHHQKIHYARRFLGVSWSMASHLAGWEWVLESALRKGGYVTAVHSGVPEV